MRPVARLLIASYCILAYAGTRHGVPYTFQRRLARGIQSIQSAALLIKMPVDPHLPTCDRRKYGSFPMTSSPD